MVEEVDRGDCGAGVKKKTGGGYGVDAVFGSRAGRVEVFDRRSTGWRAP